MKKYYLAIKTIVLVVLIGAIAWSAPKVVALWNFKSEPEMKQVVPVYVNNTKATYYVINRAYHQHIVGQAALQYRDMLDKDRDNGYLQAAYAFSQFMAAGPVSGDYFKYEPGPVIHKLKGQQMDADFYRSESVKNKPNNAGVLLEAGIAQYQVSSRYESQLKSEEWLGKAVQLAPDWAEAHYWYGTFLEHLWTYSTTALGGKPVDVGYWGKKEQMEKIRERFTPAELSKIIHEALKEINTAEKLQPELAPECTIARAYIYQAMNDPARQLEAMNKYTKLKPEAAKLDWFIKWREYVKKEIKNK